MLVHFAVSEYVLWNPPELDTPRRGQWFSPARYAPGSELLGFDGAPIDIEAAMKGRDMTIVAVWASWCSPCRRELKRLRALAIERPWVAVIAVNIDDESATLDALRWVEAIGGPLIYCRANIPNPRGVGRRTTPLPTSLPATIVLDAGGDVIATGVGEAPALFRRIDAWSRR
jgi:thiol-disulfide isomerase/thioredoxin